MRKDLQFLRAPECSIISCCNGKENKLKVESKKNACLEAGKNNFAFNFPI